MAEVQMPNSLEYPGNSKLSQKKEELEKQKEKPKKLVSGSIKKKTLGKKFAEVFFSDDVVDVKSYLIYDVLIPALKNTINEAISSSVEMLLFGDVRPRGAAANKNQSKTYVSYSNYYTKDKEPRPSTSPRRNYFSEEVMIPTRQEAEEVLYWMKESIKDYGSVSVADFYDLCDITSEFTDNKYGWTNLDTAYIRRVRDNDGRMKYCIAMPKTEIL